MIAIKSQPKLLLVEDDINLGYLLVENLRAKAYAVTLATNGVKGLNAAANERFDLCILDVMLPGEDGFSVAQRLRKVSPGVPFLFVTSRIQEADRIRGFELGCEDYISKPFSFKELEYRLQVILRRRDGKPVIPKAEILNLGNLSLETASRKLSVDGKDRKLSQRECELLEMLLEAKGSYVSRSDILGKLWGREDFFTAKSMDVYLTRIRKLIREAPEVEIENLYGSGYRIRLTEAGSGSHLY